jgi:hypothetical protein
MEAGRQSRLDLFKRGFNLPGRVGRDDALRLGVQQAAAARREAVVKKDVR